LKKQERNGWICYGAEEETREGKRGSSSGENSGNKRGKKGLLSRAPLEAAQREGGPLVRVNERETLSLLSIFE
jgi:hypothetical protein